MKKDVTIVELGLYERMVPLVGGYLESYATQDTNISHSYNFLKMSWTNKVGLREMTNHLIRLRSDIYAFSCYVWNVRLVLSAVDGLLSELPNAQIILGGPQVMHQGHEYLRKTWDRVVICNGEGEDVFANYLRAQTNEASDLSRICGLSFIEDGELVTTRPASRVSSLDAIPSPFLGGMFLGDYGISVFETNRGCPFSCGFCYWGAATNDRVFKFDDYRLREEIKWISKQGILFVYIADANWGMLKRDVELSRWFVECKKANRTPNIVYYSASKNSPERVTEITRIFRNSGVITSQPVSLQTLSSEALHCIDRENIKKSAYAKVRESLAEDHIGSYTELIWPLPGETLSSFKDGIQELCEVATDTIIVYPHLLLVNTPIHRRRNEFDLLTRKVSDGISDAEIVTSTRSVSPFEFEQGMRLFYAVHLLHNARVLRAVSAYVNDVKLSPFSDLFFEFSSFAESNLIFPTAGFVERSVTTTSCYDLFNYGEFIHLALDAERESCAELVYNFISSRGCWAEENVRFLFEIDRLSQPYVYSSTPFSNGKVGFSLVDVQSPGSRSWDVRIPERFEELFLRFTSIETPSPSHRYVVNHSQLQHPFMKSEGLEHNAGYCHGAMLRMESIMPRWTSVC